MNRIDFIQTLNQKCTDMGYTFQHGFVYRMNEGIKGYPLFWFCPLVLTGSKTDGIESWKTYSAEAYVHELNNKYNEDEKELVWQRQEDFAILLLEHLPYDSDVVYVSEIKCVPDEFQFKDGTISTRVTFTIQIYNCEQDK